MGRAQGMRSRWWRWRCLNERRTQCEIHGNRVLDDPLTLWEYVLCSDPNVAASQKRRNVAERLVEAVQFRASMWPPPKRDGMAVNTLGPGEA